MKLKHTIGSLERQIGIFVKTVQSLQHDTNLLNDQNDKYYERIQELEAQRDGLLVACKAALEKCPFPVGAVSVKAQLKAAIAKTKELTGGVE